jgi:hypothetical protein
MCYWSKPKNDVVANKLKDSIIGRWEEYGDANFLFRFISRGVGRLHHLVRRMTIRTGSSDFVFRMMARNLFGHMTFEDLPKVRSEPRFVGPDWTGRVKPRRKLAKLLWKIPTNAKAGVIRAVMERLSVGKEVTEPINPEDWIASFNVLYGLMYGYVTSVTFKHKKVSNLPYTQQKCITWQPYEAVPSDPYTTRAGELERQHFCGWERYTLLTPEEVAVLREQITR